MSKGNVRRPAFVALVIAFSVTIAGIALASEYEPVRPPPPQPGFAAPVVMVCRVTDTFASRPGRPGQCTTGIENLTNGETVQVTVAAFNVNSSGTLHQCTLDLTLCEAQGVPFTTGSNGASNPMGEPNNPADPIVTPTPFTVKTTFQAANGQTVNCLVTPCVIYASMNTASQNLAACHGLTFAGGPASSCTIVPTPTTSVPSPTTSTSTSTTMAPTTTTTTMAPTTTTMAPTTTTMAPTTTTTIAPTTTTMAPTTTTMAPTTTSTTTAPTTTTSVVGTSTTLGPVDRCAQLRAARAAFNAQIDQLIAAVNAVNLSAEQRNAVLAQLAAVRAQGNAQLDAALAGCATATT